ncbi:MAG TPA: 5'-3' exonuclease H3TH domain-containing protein [Thermoanaerobaculia bacterium]|jgi:5'-3' exonuclease|nr:5'-3' exonuclease H3TH domain-containing protein [Thermoanaerobaculia bacterium]
MAATVYLVDASPYIFRAHFSLPSSIKTPAGEPAAASYGFTSFLLKLIADEKPSHLAVTFDRSLNSSFRNDLYPAYKQQRVLPPPELEAQLDACVEIAAALGAATFIDDRYEADDLIGALCARLEKEDHRAVIVTSDKDLAQLVDDRITLLDFGKGIRLDAAAVVEKFGVRPDQITDYLGLAGDTVDNIPGVKGIGGKSAAELLARFGHLEDLYARLDELPSLAALRGAKSLHAKLAASRDLAFLSKRLATVAREVPGVKSTLKDLEYHGAAAAGVEELFQRLGFNKIRDRVPYQA